MIVIEKSWFCPENLDIGIVFWSEMNKSDALPSDEYYE